MAATGILTRRAFFVSLTLLAALTAIFLIPDVPAQAQTINLVTSPVDSAKRVVWAGQRAPWALPENYQAAVPRDLMLEHLILVLNRSPQKQKAFEKFLKEVQNPRSRQYHRWLTPVQVGSMYGASQHDIDAVTGWLSEQGLHVNAVANNRIMIDFSGTAGQIGAAFATGMHYYWVGGEQRIGAAEEPQIPAALTAVIQSVSGLYTANDHAYHGAESVSVPMAGSELPALSLCNGGTCQYFVTPQDFAVIYDLGALQVGGLGQTIAIIGRARVYNPDIQNFASLTGVATQPPNVIVPPNGLDPGQPAGTGGTASGDQVEATIDVMRAGSVAPQATIDLVISANSNSTSGLRVAAQYVVDTNPVFAQVMNVSFGACEADRTQADVQFWDSVFSMGAAEGISSFVASGDAGAAGCDSYFQVPPQSQVASPNYICSSSYDTCVGGTEFADASNPSQYWSPTNGGFLGSALRYIPEGGWNEPLNGNGTPQAAASGGGVSSYIATPPWQVGVGVPGTQGRYTPDIAFTSAAHDGYFGCLAASGGTHPGDCVVRNGSFYFEYFFGTSCAAPSMAGMTALLNQQNGGPQGEINQRLYQLAANPANAVFNDVTVATSAVSGCEVTTPSMCNNSTPSPTGLTGGLAGYLVNAGYDEVTGWGSINGGNLLSSWIPSSATTTAVVSSPNPANLGTAVTFTATVATSGTNPPTGTVNFDDGTTPIGSGSLSNVSGSQVATFTTSTLSVGTHSITAVYSGDSNNAPSASAALTQTINAPTFTWVANGGTTGGVLSGQSATYNFTATPTSAGTFAANVSLSCSGLPDATVTCGFNPTQINQGAGSTPVQLTITTTGPNPASPGGKSAHIGERHISWVPFAPFVALALVGFAGRKASKRLSAAALGISLVLTGILLACGGGSSATPVSVMVSSGSPSSIFPNDTADNWPSQTAQFTATVTNATNTAVTWAVVTPNAGTISASGLYTAPTVASGLPTTVTIMATSAADPSKSGTGQESLKPATIPGTYSNIMATATEATTVNAVPVTLSVQ